MATLQQRIVDDMKMAMKDRDTARVSVLRMVYSAIKNAAIDASGKEVADQDVVRIIKKEIKQREETIEQLAKAGRDEAVKEGHSMITILQTYLPEELSSEVVAQYIDAIIESTGATSVADMGKVMKELMPKLQGQFDGKTAQQLVQQKLQS